MPHLKTFPLGEVACGHSPKLPCRYRQTEERETPLLPSLHLSFGALKRYRSTSAFSSLQFAHSPASRSSPNHLLKIFQSGSLKQIFY